MKNLLAGLFFPVAFLAGNAAAAPAKDVLADPTFKLSTPFRDGWSASTVAVQADGKILVGNPDFNTSFPGPGAVFRLTSTGKLDSTFTPALGTKGSISCIAPLPDGRVLVGGTLNHYNANGGVTMLKADGSRDTSYQMGYTGSGATLALVGRVETILLRPDGKALVGGQFGGPVPLVNTPGIARLNADGSVDSGFDPEGGIGDSGTVRVIAADTVSKKIYIGGTFVWYGGTSRHGIARLNEDGSLDKSFVCPLQEAKPLNYPSPDIQGIAVQPDGKVIISTEGIVSYGGVPVRNLVRVHPNGKLDTAFTRQLAKTPGLQLFPGRVILLKNGKILVRGAVGPDTGAFATGLIRLNADGSVDPSFTQKTVHGGLSDMVADKSGKVLLAGKLSQKGWSGTRGVARILPSATVQCKVRVKSASSSKGSVKGNKTVDLGDSVSVTAKAKKGFKFFCWKEGGKIVSRKAKFSFKVRKDRKLKAYFR
jgi:uncharacterized delta-60 repeat protein